MINNQKEVAELLLNHKCDANLKNSFNRTALDEAVHLEKEEMAVKHHILCEGIVGQIHQG